jgi:hypothetical protein
MIETRCQYSFLCHSIDLFVLDRDENGKAVKLAPPVVPVEYEFEMVKEPTIRLHLEQAQALMDQLWQCGLRPTEGSGSAGSLSQAENHIESLKRIAFKLVDRL